jgi:hypothetical protein
MSFAYKVGSFPNLGYLILWDANIHIHHTMTFPACEVMMVLVPAGPVGMASIRKLNWVQQTHIAHQ